MTTNQVSIRRAFAITSSLAVVLSCSLRAEQSVLARRNTPHGELQVVNGNGSQSLQLATPSGLRRIPLPEKVRQVADVFGSKGGRRAYVVADNRLFGFDTGSARNTINVPAVRAAVSPSAQFVAYVRTYLAGEGEGGTAMWIADADSFNAEGDAKRAYPEGGKKADNYVVSDPTWIDDQTLAYLHLDTKAGQSAVHVIDLARGVASLQRHEKTLDAPAMVYPERYDSNRVPAAAVLRDAKITKLEGPGLRLRLRFPSDSALKVRRVDVTIW